MHLDMGFCKSSRQVCTFRINALHIRPEGSLIDTEP